jgi:hypothetical protein
MQDASRMMTYNFYLFIENNFVVVDVVIQCYIGKGNEIGVIKLDILMRVGAKQSTKIFRKWSYEVMPINLISVKNQEDCQQC